MIRSMTGYGRAENTIDDMSICVEAKSVNHRFFEFSARLPKSYGFLEDKLKSLFQSRLSRGKIDVFVSIDTNKNGGVKIGINHEYAGGYLKALKELSETYGILDDISVSMLAKNDDVFTVTRQAIDEEAVWDSVQKVAVAAIDAFVGMRENEGLRLVEDVKNRVRFITDCVEKIEEITPQTVVAYRERLEQKVRDLLADNQIDEQRLLTETAIFADKIAVSEETVRLRSHMTELLNLFEKNEAVGRKLDFIVQEMNREANTIGSKCQHMEVTRIVVDIKAEIEKIREQIQNIE